jgi:hypothetical protein
VNYSGCTSRSVPFPNSPFFLQYEEKRTKQKQGTPLECGSGVIKPSGLCIYIYASKLVLLRSFPRFQWCWYSSIEKHDHDHCSASFSPASESALPQERVSLPTIPALACVLYVGDNPRTHIPEPGKPSNQNWCYHADSQKIRLGRVCVSGTGFGWKKIRRTTRRHKS